jgi:hypothetical protein
VWSVVLHHTLLHRLPYGHLLTPLWFTCDFPAHQALALARESARMSLSVAVSGSELPSEWGGGTPRTTGEPHSPAGDAGWGPSHSMYLVTGVCRLLSHC